MSRGWRTPVSQSLDKCGGMRGALPGGVGDVEPLSGPRLLATPEGRAGSPPPLADGGSGPGVGRNNAGGSFARRKGGDPRNLNPVVPQESGA